MPAQRIRGRARLRPWPERHEAPDLRVAASALDRDGGRYVHIMPLDDDLLLPTAGEPEASPFDVHVVYGRDVERQQLRYDEPPNDRQPERTTRFATGPETQGDGQRADERRHGRH